MPLSFDFIYRRIQSKIVLLISIITLFFSLAMTLAIKKYIPPVIHANLEERGVSIAQHLASECVNYLLTDDLVAIYDILNDTKENNKEMVYIFVLDQDNTPLIHTFPAKIPEILLHTPRNAYHAPHIQPLKLNKFGRIIDITLPIITNSTRLGTVRLGLTEQYNETIIQLFFKNFFVVLFFTSLCGFIAALLFSNQLIIKPIKDLMVGARRIGLGDKSHPITVISNDEIGELATEFNTMANRLREMDQTNKESLAEVRQLRNYLSNIIDSMPSMLFGVNLQGEITLWNKKIARSTGTQATTAQGRKLAEIIPHMANNIGEIDSSIKKRKIIRKQLLPRITEAGNCYEEMTIFPLLANGMEGAVVRIDNITERKALENALHEANDELEHRVIKRTEELQFTHKKLLHSEKLAAIGSLSASIAHEFNNPLAGITNVICGIKRRAKYSSDDAILIDLAIKECERIRSLINNLQDFNRPSRGEISPMNIHDAINSLLMLSKKEYNEKGITLIKRYAAAIPSIMAVSDQIKQVLLNLLNNAFFACEKGDSITITTETIPDNKIAIRISDTGTGIKPDHINHIFEPFFTTKPDISGTGLGLSVCYGIIKEHGGTIKVESAIHKGSTFSVTLPLKRHG